MKFSHKIYQITDKKGLTFTLNNDKEYREERLQKVKLALPETRAKIDVVHEAHKEHKAESIIRHKEGLEPSLEAPRRTARERRPVAMLINKHGEQVKYEFRCEKCCEIVFRFALPVRLRFALRFDS